MPKAMFAIWWDNTLGPMTGRSYPEDIALKEDEALVVFMGHGTQQEAKIGYTNLSRGLIISYLETPNCIAVLLDEDDDTSVVERNLQRIVSEIDFNADTWDDELKKSFHHLHELIRASSGDELLSDPSITRLIRDMEEERLDSIIPKHTLHLKTRYPNAAEYLGQDIDEVERKLHDLANEELVITKTYGRKVECTSCGSSEVEIVIHCPNCDSKELYNVYSIFCPHCKDRIHSVIEDDITEIICQSCKRPVSVSNLDIISVEPLCKSCGTATDKPKISLKCGVCNRPLEAVDLLGGTGLAYYPAGKE